MRTLMAAAVMALAMEAAQAQPPMPSHFSGPMRNGDIDLYLTREYSVVEISTETCTGGVEGKTKIVGRTIVLKDGTCTLRVTFNEKYTRARIAESNCTHLHGASCQFEGPALRRQ